MWTVLSFFPFPDFCFSQQDREMCMARCEEWERLVGHSTLTTSRPPSSSEIPQMRRDGGMEEEAFEVEGKSQ